MWLAMLCFSDGGVPSRGAVSEVGLSWAFKVAEQVWCRWFGEELVEGKCRLCLSGDEVIERV